ncbi:hypothetical protein EST38_g14254 [Candolleomyces aberdarensis]|uniref:F-box protein n=1 Tax=Candolleomyces aberdarensis TaxID=2316362 RepID=A0A4Q2D059_9AGAR|nr:hypothetical protein EST38_g14254 [Candolleomyces aberdarensis]
MGQLLQLETLRLIKYLPCSRDVSHPSGRSLPISLPSLRTLELDDSTAEVHHFFNATQISKEAKVGLALTDEDSVFGSLGALFSALKASWILSSQDMDVDTNGSQLPAQSDILDLRTVEEIQIGYSGIKCWFKHNKLPTKFDDDNPPADLVVSADNIITTSLLTAIADSSDLSSLRSLKISSYDDLEEDGLALFKNLTKLDTIAICDNYETLSIFLKEFQKQGSDTTSPSFPALRSVHLHNIDFDGPLVRKPDDAVRALVTAFENREASHPIEQLTISKCINFSEVHWKDLCASSFSEDVNMDWDEDEYIHDYYDDYDDHDFDTYGYGSD